MNEEQLSKAQHNMGLIMNRLKDVKVLPQVVYKVLEVCDRQDSSPIEIERQIAIDPGFTAKILTIANSAHYALPKRVNSIHEAVMLLGFNEIREIGMKASVFDFFLGKSDAESLRRRDWWRLSVDTAILSKTLAKHSRLDPDAAYTAGLLHLIGRTLLDQTNASAYEKVLYVVGRGAPLRLAETTVFSVDHIQVAEEVARKWAFPEELVYALNYVDPPTEGSEANSIRAVISAAHTIVEHSTGALIGTPCERSSNEWAFETLQMSQESINAWIASATELLGSRTAA